MRQVVTIFAVLSSLLLVPALCVGGVLIHACDCMVETCCLPDTGTHDQSGCGHESGCCDDPCDMRVVRTEHRIEQMVAAPRPMVCSLMCMDAGKQLLVWAKRLDLQESRRTNCQPYPSSDLPLLI